MPEPVIDDVAVEIEFAGIFRLERADLQFDDHERPQTQMVEQQIDVVVFVSDIQPILPPNEGEPLPKFDEELLKVTNQAGFEFSFVKGFFQSQEIEDVWVFQRLLRQIGLRGWQTLCRPWAIGQPLVAQFVACPGRRSDIRGRTGPSA